MTETTHHTSELVTGMAAALGVTIDPNMARIDPEEDTRKRVLAARTELWNRLCPSNMKESDWQHPRLAPYRTQINKVLGWQATPGGKGLLLVGPTGRGKTRSLWALMKRLMCEESRDVGYWNAIDWFSALGRNLNYGRDDAAGFVRSCAKRPILVIDDLGQEAVVQSRESWAQSWLFSLLDERLSEGRHTLITTNLSADQIAGTKDRDCIRGEPLVRRLLELCEVTRFELFPK